MLATRPAYLTRRNIVLFESPKTVGESAAAIMNKTNHGLVRIMERMVLEQQTESHPTKHVSRILFDERQYMSYLYNVSTISLTFDPYSQIN